MTCSSVRAVLCVWMEEFMGRSLDPAEQKRMGKLEPVAVNPAQKAFLILKSRGLADMAYARALLHALHINARSHPRQVEDHRAVVAAQTSCLRVKHGLLVQSLSFHGRNTCCCRSGK